MQSGAGLNPRSFPLRFYNGYRYFNGNEKGCGGSLFFYIRRRRYTRRQYLYHFIFGRHSEYSGTEIHFNRFFHLIHFQPFGHLLPIKIPEKIHPPGLRVLFIDRRNFYLDVSLRTKPQNKLFNHQSQFLLPFICHPNTARL